MQITNDMIQGRQKAHHAKDQERGRENKISSLPAMTTTTSVTIVVRPTKDLFKVLATRTFTCDHVLQKISKGVFASFGLFPAVFVEAIG